MAEEGHKVSLNVYDLSQGLARQLSMTFLGKAIEGIWHTGVVVYGNEYYFGGGIQNTPVGKTPYGTPIRVIDLGVTHVPKDVFEMYLQEISPRYTQETYSLLTHNCNNFSNEVAQFLVGATIPEYILNLPNEVINSPMGAMFLPMIQQLETTLRAGAVPQTPQFNPITVTSAAPKVSSAQINPTTVTSAAPKVSSASNGKVSESKSKPATSGPQNSSSNGTAPSENKAAASEVKSPAKSVKADPLGDARSKVQEEIAREFTAIMATGTFRASEAAALATKKVMQRYGHMNAAQS